MISNSLQRLETLTTQELEQRLGPSLASQVQEAGRDSSLRANIIYTALGAAGGVLLSPEYQPLESIGSGLLGAMVLGWLFRAGSLMMQRQVRLRPLINQNPEQRYDILEYFRSVDNRSFISDNDQ